MSIQVLVNLEECILAVLILEKVFGVKNHNTPWWEGDDIPEGILVLAESRKKMDGGLKQAIIRSEEDMRLWVEIDKLPSRET